jgi:hypothetical protein
MAIPFLFLIDTIINHPDFRAPVRPGRRLSLWPLNRLKKPPKGIEGLTPEKN